FLLSSHASVHTDLLTLSLHDALPIFNDRVDIASMYHIQHVHLPSHGHDVTDVKRHLPHVQIGCSVHDVTEAKRQAQVNYMFFGQDRKSTRLNSSHVSISYAVFCLKQK